MVLMVLCMSLMKGIEEFVYGQRRAVFRDFKTKYVPTYIAATVDNHLLVTSYSSNT